MKPRVLNPIALIASAMLCSFFLLSACTEKKNTDPGPKPNSINLDSPEVAKRMQKSCSRCHKFPDPGLLPKAVWPITISKMYEFLGMKGKALDGFTAEQVSAWFQKRAPDTIPIRQSHLEKSKIAFKETRFSPPGPPPPSPAVSSVKLVDRVDGRGQDLLFSDMRHKFVLKLDVAKGFKKPRITLVTKAPHPCHMEIVDVDSDSFPDLLIANLGSFNPDDHDKGSVSLIPNFRQTPRQSITLAKGLGRVTDARSADFNGDGHMDVLVGVFGFQETGEVFWLKNNGLAGSKRRFSRKPVDGRHGVIHTPIADFNNDGRPDFLAQFSQEHESVVSFMNTGGEFQGTIINTAPHPAWGSNGIELADIDGDGDLDAILCNGDTLDDRVPKPSHGLRWLENKGPKGGWEDHEILPMYGAHGAKAADIDGDGDLDIVASAFLPHKNPKGYLAGTNTPSLVWFEQTKSKTFKPWVIETMNVFHPCLDLGDLDGDGDIDIVVGNFTMKIGDWDKIPYWVQVWINPGRKN
ncbi:MAG: VCBS repeat-containing protein [Planctomycetota bacterium]|nr:VCBS repeat-containing protein [Planctomycetota bacterium]